MQSTIVAPGARSRPFPQRFGADRPHRPRGYEDRGSGAAPLGDAVRGDDSLEVAMARVLELSDELGGIALFADLSRPQLEAIAHEFDESWFGQDERILREGLTGSGFYVILEGEVAIRAGGRDVAVLARGDFFGEVSVLLGEPPSADVVALRPVRCLQLAGPVLKRFLLSHPDVMYRILLDQTRRLRTTTHARG
jgi:CRP-like cAMP-binding protein